MDKIKIGTWYRVADRGQKVSEFVFRADGERGGECMMSDYSGVMRIIPKNDILCEANIGPMSVMDGMLCGLVLVMFFALGVLLGRASKQ